MKPEHEPAARLIRASDADRDEVVVKLGDALAEGSLDPDEYETRLHKAMTAAVRRDLEPLTADLPASRAALARAEAERKAAKRASDAREWRSEWSYWAGGALIMNAIWGVTAVGKGELGFYWPGAPLAIWAVILLSYALWPGDKKDDPPEGGS